jgi:peroxiredoxin
MAEEKKAQGSAKKVIFLVALVLLATLAIAGFIAMGKKGGLKIITTGDLAPDFALPALNGRTISLSELRGKVVMVHFWATWCPPCVEELPTLVKLNRDLQGTDFEMLAVSVDEGGAEAVSAFLARNRLDLPVLLDPDRSAAKRYGTFKFPETYLVDRGGVVRHKVIGPADWADPEAVRFIRDLMAKQ